MTRSSKTSSFLGCSVAVALMIVSFDSAATPKEKPQASKVEKGLPTPGYLPELARAFLRQKMQNHGRDMQDLVRHVILLRYKSASELAQKIASEPRLVRPIVGGENDLNAALPEQLFVLQDELRNQSKHLADAAAKENSEELSAALGRVTETCISCHSAYLKPAPKAP